MNETSLGKKICLIEVSKGKKFGYWTVLDTSIATYENGYHILCQCICGVIKPVMRRHLRSGRSKSCDCQGRDKNLCKLCNKIKTGTHKIYCQECYNAYKRNWYQNHKEEEYIRNRNWYLNNKDKVAKNMRDWRKNNHSQYIKTLKEYRNKNRDRLRLHEKNKNTKRRNAIGFDRLTIHEWESIKKYYNYKCFYCLIKPFKLTLDHYIPLCRGGRHEISNIVPACLSCNTKKTYLMPHIFIERMKYERI